MADEKETSVFKALQTRAWKEVFADSCSGNWQDKWFLDGQAAKVSNDSEAMTIDTAKGYAVLWTKPSFEGDLRIEYDFKRADRNNKGVNIIYIQATGDSDNGCVEDISKWSEKRKNAAMSDYYMNMHTYHISYAAYPKDYVRGRRYLPLKNKGLGGTNLKGEYHKTGLFEDNKWIHITIIKQARQLWMEFKHPDKTLLCHFKNEDKKKAPILKGRIGLRLMPGRMSQFKNFKVMSAPAASVLAAGGNWKTYRGKAGPSGWQCNVIQPDPKNAGPDGINLHDWDGDGDLDVFVNYEEGAYSRLYFNPGKDKIRDLWTDYIEWKHGKCEDSGIGDLDNDGDIDVMTTEENGGWGVIWFENPARR